MKKDAVALPASMCALSLLAMSVMRELTHCARLFIESRKAPEVKPTSVVALQRNSGESVWLHCTVKLSPFTLHLFSCYI
jgi:hypothetical protein